VKRSHAGIVFTQWFKNWFFASQGRHVAPINVKFGMGDRTSPVPNFTFVEAEMWPPKLSKFRILAINLPPRGDSFSLFLRNSQRL